MNHTPTHKARKRFGQNFLHDPAVIQRIVNVIAPQKGQQLIEIGPGQAALTIPLLQACGKMHAVELDRDLIPIVEQACAMHGALTLHNADALKFDFKTIKTDERKLRMIGNLPYNISTPILFRLLEQRDIIEDMHFMLQKEVVDRMAAGPNSKTYGRLSVMLQAYCHVESIFDIGPGAFKPAPKIDSSIVRLTPFSHTEIETFNHGSFADIVRTSFSQRRKTLRNNLKKILDNKHISAIGIDPGCRAETLSVASFIALANKYDAITPKTEPTS